MKSLLQSELWLSIKREARKIKQLLSHNNDPDTELTEEDEEEMIEAEEEYDKTPMEEGKVYDVHKKEVDDLIGYAWKEGYIGDEAEFWTDEEKEDYYNKSMEAEDHYNDYMMDAYLNGELNVQ